MKKFVILGAILFIAVILLLFTFLGGGSEKVPAELTKPKNLVWWGVVDDGNEFQGMINSYVANHSNVTITYKKLRADEYEDALIRAWAKDAGPDIFSVPHNAVPHYQEFIEPLPAKTTVAQYSRKKSLGIKEELKIEKMTTDSLSLSQLKNQFVDVVSSDVVVAGKIMALPFTVDALALIYNRDHFNQAQIPLPPQNYNELIEDVKVLTIFDQQDNIVQSGIALGGGENISQATDLLTLIMMQSGAQMAQGNKVTFNQSVKAEGEEAYYPAEDALLFYTSFANPKKETYTWNNKMTSSIEAFANGDVSIIFAYSYQLPIINQLSQGKVNYGIAKIPFHNREVNIANYWVQTVAKKSKNKDVAWNFLQYATSEKQVASYIEKNGRPSALLAYINQLANDPILSAYAPQTLVAKSWYHGQDPELMENYIIEMIDNVNSGLSSEKEAVSLAAEQIQQTY